MAAPVSASKSAPAVSAPLAKPKEVLSTMVEITQRSRRVFGKVVKKQAGAAWSMARDEFGISKAFFELWRRLMTSPMLLAEAQLKLWRESTELLQGLARRLWSGQVPDAGKPDNRFKDEAWRSNVWFDFLRQSYLLAARSLTDLVADTQGLSPEARKKVTFFTRQFVDAMSPSNFALLNPTVLAETMRTGGLNLLKGYANLLRDLEDGGGELKVRMTDPDAFRVGVNVATAPGKVVFQNDLAQLLQFDPTTPTQLKRPLLIVPPWINKYYILDLRESNSFIRWATAQGHTVFVLSWVNPDRDLAKKRFDDYLLEGPLAALDAIERATGERQVNAVGYCLGGTLLGATLGYLAAKGDTRIASATFLVSLLDFSIPGDLGVFIDEAQVENLERRMNARGYLEGSEMAQTFNLLRANDLVWSFVVNNYLLGKDAAPFDLLAWNADATRMPAVMHSFYLRNMYLKNKLREPGGISLDGTPIDLSKSTVPAYFVSTAEDHIAPWKSTYLGSLALGGPVRFVLGGSGHIAGIVNPPSANKYGFLTNDARPKNPDEWQAGAKRNEGSWWTDWQAWVSALDGTLVPARKPGDGELPVLGDAPGSYVATRA